MKKILLLGSGELGKEFVIAAKRLGQYVIAADSYDNAPAMQVADDKEVLNMLDGKELDRIVTKHQPDIIVPEVEAIRTERFYDYEKQHIQVVPSAKAANYTMNRKAIRDLAANKLGLKTAKFCYAKSEEELINATKAIGLPCVVKPLMSSSGKGQSTIKKEEDISTAWKYAIEGSRGDVVEVIVEEFITFDLEITLLTLTTKDGNVLYCPPVGHRQERGDYQESWQPALIKEKHLLKAQNMAQKVTQELGGAGIWGIEFFITKDDVYFSELSPRPHDTGMVTLGNTQNLNEFELHARAILGLPIPEIRQQQFGVSAVILAKKDSIHPILSGIENALQHPLVDLKIFGKPTSRPYRRMGVITVSDEIGSDLDHLRKLAKQAADKIKID